MVEFFLGVGVCEHDSLLHLVEQGGIGVSFAVLLVFILQQFRRLMEQLSSLHGVLVGVVEKNTQAYGEMRQALEGLSEKLEHASCGA
jgi:hypothetical protein